MTTVEAAPARSAVVADATSELYGVESINLASDRDLRRRTPLFDVFLGLSLASCIVAIAAGRPEFLVLGAPFIVTAALALARWRPIDGEVRIGIDTTHIVEGQQFNLVIEVDAPSVRLDRVEVELDVSERVASAGTLRAVTTVDGGSTRRLAFPVVADEWGVAKVTRATIRVVDRFGMFGGRIERWTDVTMRIGLPEDRLGATLDAERFRRVVGSHLSGDRGEGLEIADIRPYLPGDSMRDINWRITNRRREPWVTLRHPDRSANVVVIVDAHDGDSAERSATQRRSVAAAMALTRGHLANHDPVGLLVVGHTVRWLPPRLGRNHLYRIADELISVSNAPDASLRLYRPPAVDNIARETVVVAVTPLRDPLMVSLIAELRSRGNAVAVLVPEVEEAPAARLPVRVESRAAALARRFADVEKSIGAESLRARGVVLVPWASGDPVTAVIDAVTRLRQSMRRTAR